MELPKPFPLFFPQAELRVNSTNVRMVLSIRLRNFLTSFLSLFTFKTNIMPMIQSIIIVKVKLNSIPNYVFHILLLVLR